MPLKVAMLKAGAVDRAYSTRSAPCCLGMQLQEPGWVLTCWPSVVTSLATTNSCSSRLFVISCHKVRMVCHNYERERDREREREREREKREFDLHPATRVLYLLYPDNSESKRKLAKCFLGSSTTPMLLPASSQTRSLLSFVFTCFCHST